LPNLELRVLAGVVSANLAGTIFGKTHILHARAGAVPAFICFDVTLVAYVTHGPRFLKTHTK